MYDNVHSKVRITNCYIMQINVSVGVHQESVLNPLLFVFVMEALSCEFRIGYPWELLHADELVIALESFDGLKRRLKNWKEGLEVKGLKINVGKTKAMCSRHDTPSTKITSVFPCVVCWKGVGANSIHCLSCKKCGNQHCSGIRESLWNFICKTCSSAAGTDDPFPAPMTVDGAEFE